MKASVADGLIAVATNHPGDSFPPRPTPIRCDFAQNRERPSAGRQRLDDPFDLNNRAQLYSDDKLN
jgi:hypothetical protein